MNKKNYIAKRAAQEIKNEDIVNLGIGLPTKVVEYLSNDINIYIHSENGILGLGPTPETNKIDKNLINASKLPVTIMEGSSFFDSPASFGIIRGGHVDVAILGVLQVDKYGIIANWAIPGKDILGVGGAMDLLEGSKKIIVTMLHTTKNGEVKIVDELTYPKTSHRRVDVIITEIAVFRTDENGLILTEIAPEKTLEEVKEKTNAKFRISPNLKEISKED